jgi:hypothetical protein
MGTQRLQLENGQMRTRPNVFEVLFAAQMLFSIGYACFLLYLSTENSAAADFIVQSLSVVTEPIANFLPLSKYAEAVANPRLHITTQLIRHLFPLLLLINVPLGLVLLGWSRRLSPGFENLLMSNPRTFNTLVKVWWFGAAVTFYLLFLDAPLSARMSPSPMSLLGFVMGAISPVFFFACICQIVAMRRAGRRPYQ